MDSLIIVEQEKQEVIKIYREYEKIGQEKAIEMGRHLSRIKDKVGHGNFGKWIEDNLPFSWQSAAKYMTVYRMSIREEGLDPTLGIEEVYQLGKKQKLIPMLEPEKPIKPVPKEPELLPVKLQPSVKTEESPKFKETLNLKPEKVKEPEEPEPMTESEQQDGWVEDIKDLYVKLDDDHKGLVIDWILEYKEAA